MNNKELKLCGNICEANWTNIQTKLSMCLFECTHTRQPDIRSFCWRGFFSRKNVRANFMRKYEFKYFLLCWMFLHNQKSSLKIHCSYWEILSAFWWQKMLLTLYSLCQIKGEIPTTNEFFMKKFTGKIIKRFQITIESIQWM